MKKPGYKVDSSTFTIVPQINVGLHQHLSMSNFTNQVVVMLDHQHNQHQIPIQLHNYSARCVELRSMEYTKQQNGDKPFTFAGKSSTYTIALDILEQQGQVYIEELDVVICLQSHVGLVKHPSQVYNETMFTEIVDRAADKLEYSNIHSQLKLFFNDPRQKIPTVYASLLGTQIKLTAFNETPINDAQEPTFVVIESHPIDNDDVLRSVPISYKVTDLYTIGKVILPGGVCLAVTEELLKEAELENCARYMAKPYSPTPEELEKYVRTEKANLDKAKADYETLIEDKTKEFNFKQIAMENKHKEITQELNAAKDEAIALAVKLKQWETINEVRREHNKLQESALGLQETKLGVDKATINNDAEIIKYKAIMWKTVGGIIVASTAFALGMYMKNKK